jgi:arylformamidase
MKTFTLVLYTTVWLVAADAKAETAPALPPPQLRDVHYAEHERNVLDLWEAKSSKPTPLLVYIHGGGWRGGDKSALPPRTLQFMLEHNVSVASINYRYSSMARLPAPVHDAARAIQFLRSKSSEWNLKKDKIAAMGASAGACTALWLAYHDDLANRDSSDPIARESTRLCAALNVSGQTSIDPEVIARWVGDPVLDHGMISGAVGATNRTEVKARYRDFKALYQEFSPINHVSAGDPPIIMLYPTPTPLPATNSGIAIHHAELGRQLKEKADAAGLIAVLNYSPQPDQSARESLEFLLKYLTKD